jgi:ABC-type antimicrobial peptide transport system permease subunit
MIRNYLRQALRNISRNKLISVINISGLSIGLTLAVHLILYIKYELSYDRFHTKHDRIYRILSKETAPGKEPFVVALTQGKLPEVIAGIPEVEKSVRVYLFYNSDFEFGKTRFSNNVVAFADSSFFDLFSFRLLSGNPQTALKDPNSIIISKKLAVKAFNSTGVEGRSVIVNGKSYSVAGVLDDIPTNSHLQFDILCGFNDPRLSYMVQNSGNEFRTYVLLRENVDHKSALEKVCKKYADFQTVFKRGKDTGMVFDGVAQKLTDIQLYSAGIDWDVAHGNINDLRLAAGLVIFILLIAVLNFINLITVNAQTRLKEIGIRKVSGASGKDVARQFIGEAIIISFISLLIALFIISGLTWDYVNEFLGTRIPESWLLDPMIISGLVFLTAFIGFISGSYPAFYLSRFTVTRILDGSAIKKNGRNAFVKGLVLVQFIIVIFLVSGMLIFYSQVNFVKGKELGFDKSNVIRISNLNPVLYRSYESLKIRLLQDDAVEDVCLAQGISVNEFSGQYAGVPGSEPVIVRHTRITPGYLDIFRLKLKEGRDFDSTMVSDKRNFIINEVTANALGFRDDAVGKMMMMNDTGFVIGVVKDFNFSSLHNDIEPLVITLEKPGRGSVFVRIRSSLNQEQTMQFITETIREFDPLYSLEYSYVDDVFNSMYSAESRVSKILTFITIVSVLLAFMGLMALTSFMILKRVKEIGVRKINGADTSEILVMLNKEYSGLVVAAFSLATPCAIIAGHAWLSSFAYRIPLHWWFFAFAGVASILITLASVSIICWRAAVKIPVEAIRHE